MSFLAPFFLLGAAAIVGPILFHLIRRTTREVKHFPSLMFLQPTPPRQTQRSRLENLWLLLLRCLVVLALALGFARPLWQALNPSDTPPTATERTVVLLDASASMAATGAWEPAVAKVREAVQTRAERGEVAVLLFQRGVQPLVTFAEWKAMEPGERAAAVAAKLGAVKPSTGATDLGAALLQAEALLNTPDERGARATGEIVLISDLQEGSKVEGLQGHPWPEGLRVVLERVSGNATANGNVQWMPDVEETPANAAPGSVRVRVRNAEGAKAEQFALRWAGAPVESAPTAVYVPAGQTRTLRMPKPPGATGDKLVLTGDTLDFDNTLYVQPPVPEQVPVVFAGAEGSPAGRELLLFLRRATPATPSQKVEISTPAAVNETELNAARLVVLGPGAAEATVDATRAAVEGGAWLLAPLTSAEDAVAVGRLLGAPTLSATEATGQDYTLLSRIDFKHPLFALFADPRFSDFTKIHFWKHRKLNLPEIPGAKVVAEFERGAPAVVEVPLGQGRVVILASSWRPSDSQLALSTKFVPWLQNLLELSRREPPRPPQFHVGDKLPNGAVADAPGFYPVANGTNLAVNLDPAESLLAPLTEDQLRALGLPLAVSGQSATPLPADGAPAAVVATEARQKLWRWLIAAAVVILLSETILAGVVAQRAGRSPQPAPNV